MAPIESVPPYEPAPPPPYVAPPPPARRGGSGIALGVVLVVVGLFYLVVQVAEIDLSSFGWPLFIIIPGLTLLIVGFVSLGTGAAIPGGILTMVGLVLAYQNSTGNWSSWAYAWALVAPGGVGVGLFCRAFANATSDLIRQGRSLMFIALLIFLVGFVFFESILNLNGIERRSGRTSSAARAVHHHRHPAAGKEHPELAPSLRPTPRRSSARGQAIARYLVLRSNPVPLEAHFRVDGEHGRV